MKRNKDLKISDIGEFGLISRIAARFSGNLPEGVIGIGDDCAVFPREGGTSQLLTTDLLIENTHFLIKRITPEDLGYKALAVNLSDIAAMGGRALGAFLSLGIPRRTNIDWLERFFSGFHKLSEEEGVSLLGGDTTSAPDHLVINVAVLGEVPPARCKMRSGAREGDIICLTGPVGDSAGGVKVLLEDLPHSKSADTLIRRHHRPRPHTKEGAWLSEFSGVHAMIDLSDGIHSDIQRIMERSHCGAEIHLDRLPLSLELREAADLYSWDAAAIAASGGEDYVLLCAVASEELKSIGDSFSRRFGRPLAQIGTIRPAESRLGFYSAGRAVKKSLQGFQHFSP